MRITKTQFSSSACDLEKTVIKIYPENEAEEKLLKLQTREFSATLLKLILRSLFPSFGVEQVLRFSSREKEGIDIIIFSQKRKQDYNCPELPTRPDCVI